MKPINELLQSDEDALLDNEIAQRREIIEHLRKEVDSIERHRYRRTLCNICNQPKKLLEAQLTIDSSQGIAHLCESCATNLIRTLRT